jgi:DeoR family deoxyribose operon repressor
MNKHRRAQEIVNTLRLRNMANIRELTKKFEVSEMTIRRDLSLLAKENLVDLIPGGAILKRPEDAESRYLVTNEESVRTIEKLKIGQRAVSLIEPNETIILDIGTTTEYLAKYLREDAPITVLCYTLNTLVEVYKKKNCSIIFAGGYFHPQTMMFESAEGIELIKRTRADKAFVSAAGVHNELGVTTVYPHELQAKSTILNSAKSRILVVDSSKFGKTKSVYFADISKFQSVITDNGIPEDYARFIRDLGVELILV